MPDTMLPIVAAPPITPAIPVEITKAIVAVMAGIGKLCKEEHNGHDHYNFVSIDGFLSAVNPLCAEAGLVIIQDEESVEFVERQGRNGSSTWLRITYSFTICHVSGAVMPRQPRRTVMTIANGAQAFGSAQSYSMKQFLRSLFQISTGDKDDPDFQQTQDIGQQARQRPVQRVEPSQSTQPPSKPAERTQQPPADSDEPQVTPLTMGKDGPLFGRWAKMALADLDGKSAEWRHAWFAMHVDEMTELRLSKPDYADRIDAAVIGADDELEAAE